MLTNRLSETSLIGMVIGGLFTPCASLVQGGRFLREGTKEAQRAGFAAGCQYYGTRLHVRLGGMSVPLHCAPLKGIDRCGSAGRRTSVKLLAIGHGDRQAGRHSPGDVPAGAGSGAGERNTASDSGGQRRPPGVRNFSGRGAGKRTRDKERSDAHTKQNGVQRWQVSTGPNRRDDDELSPEEEAREAHDLEIAVALAAARRGDGEHDRLLESEAPVEGYVIRGRRILVKRDDKMRLARSGLSGNKARKLYALNKIPDAVFPKLVASHGGTQSNAMVAIAAVVASKPESHFVYYTKPVPRWLRRNPVGNFARAMALGAEIIEVHPDDYKRVFGGTDGPSARYAEVVPEEALFLPQGGADAGAEEGVAILAAEIRQYWADNGESKQLRVVLPAGTGTTALFLARHLVPAGIAVYTVPCAGDGSYLRRQMEKVDRASGGAGIFPEIIEASKKTTFGVPRREFLEVWRELDDHGLFVDLLYAPPTWEVILKEWEEGSSPLDVSAATSAHDQLMYVHCGGLEGISSQLTRYKHAGLVSERQLQ